MARDCSVRSLRNCDGREIVKPSRTDGACLYNVLRPLPKSPTKADLAEALREYETIREPTYNHEQSHSPPTRLVGCGRMRVVWATGSCIAMSARMTPNSIALRQMDGYMKPHF